MDWLSFFIGVLVGWIAEWLIDFFYWRRKYQSCLQEKEALQARLEEAERRILTFQVKGHAAERETRPVPAADVVTQQAAVVAPVVDLNADLVPTRDMPDDSQLGAFFDSLRAHFPDVNLDASIARLRARFPHLDLRTAREHLKIDFPDLDIDGAFDELKAKFPRLAWSTDAGMDVEAPEVRSPDADLDVDLEATEVTLPDADLDVDLEAPDVEEPGLDIDAFFDDMRARLPDVDLDASIDRLKARFPDLDIKTAFHGLKADLPDVDIDGAFDGLRARFPHLGVATGSREGRAELPPITFGGPDDLKRIEGIGPKIARLLKDDGILTFAQLADTSVDHLEDILREAGPNFQLADPATWPEQARLAADGAWDEFRALQDRLIGGHRTGREGR